MRFEDKETFLDFSEVNTSDKISVSMGECDNPLYASYMELSKDEILRVRNFLNDALAQLE